MANQILKSTYITGASFAIGYLRLTFEENHCLCHGWFYSSNTSQFSPTCILTKELKSFFWSFILSSSSSSFFLLLSSFGCVKFFWTWLSFKRKECFQDAYSHDISRHDIYWNQAPPPLPFFKKVLLRVLCSRRTTRQLQPMCLGNFVGHNKWGAGSTVGESVPLSEVCSWICENPCRSMNWVTQSSIGTFFSIISFPI